MLDGDTRCCWRRPRAARPRRRCFPLLTRMADERWTGLSVLYVCPLKALLNNLDAAAHTYAAWLGRTRALWHGDVGAGARSAILREPPDVLLTTPESLEAMLVSTRSTTGVLRRRARRRRRRGPRLRRRRSRVASAGRAGAARAGSRAARSSASGCPRPSATRRSCSTWLQGAGSGRRPPSSRRRPAAARRGARLELDYVGTVDNAAKVIAALHRGREAAGVLRQPRAGREARRRPARARRAPRSSRTRRCRSTSADAPRRRSPRRGTA